MCANTQQYNIDGSLVSSKLKSRKYFQKHFSDFRRQCYSSICFHISKTNVTKKWPASKCYNNKKLRVLELSSVHIALQRHHSLVTGSGSISLKLKNRDHPESSNDGHSEVKKKKKKKKKKQSSDEDDDSDYSD